MPLTNFPSGVSSYGIPVLGQGSLYDIPWGNVWFVNNRSGIINGDGTSRDRPMVSLADALARAAAYDTIYVGPGHAENVTASNVFSAAVVNTGAQTIPQGCRIIGEGLGTNRPAFTLTAVASTFALAAANSSLENIQILCPQTGSTTTTAMVTVTAAGCVIRSNMFQGSASATALATTGISVGTSAADLMILDNTGFTITGTPTSWVSSASTAAPTRIFIMRNTVSWLLAVTTSGIVDMTGASVSGPTDMKVIFNEFGNMTAASTVAMKFSATTSGYAKNNDLQILAAGAASAITTPGLLVMYDNRLAQQGKQSIATTVGGNST